MKNYSAFIRYALFLVLIATTNLAYTANLYSITASAGVMVDDNLTRAQYERDIYDDRALFAGITGDYTYVVSGRSRAVLSAAAESWHYNEANLDHQTISIKGEYFFQAAAGFTAPWYSATLVLGLMPYEGNYRDANFHEVGLSAGKRLTDTTTLLAGLSHQQTSAEVDFFTRTTARVFVNLDFKFNLNTMYSTLAYSTGDFNSTNTPPHPPSLSALPWLNPNDDVAFPGLTNSWTYKLDANTWSFRLGYVYALASNQSIDASALYYTTAAYGDNDYDGMITTLAYLYRF